MLTTASTGVGVEGKATVVSASETLVTLTLAEHPELAAQVGHLPLIASELPAMAQPTCSSL
jgi:hypothetical protein